MGEKTMANPYPVLHRSDFARFYKTFDQLEGQVDTLEDLQEEMEKAKKLYEAAKKAYDDRLKKELQAGKVFEHIGLDPEAGLEVDGCDYIMIVGKARGVEYCKDPVRARRMLNRKEKGLGDELANYKLADLKKHLTGEELASLVDVNYGSRSISFKLRA